MLLRLAFSVSGFALACLGLGAVITAPDINGVAMWMDADQLQSIQAVEEVVHSPGATVRSQLIGLALILFGLALIAFGGSLQKS